MKPPPFLVNFPDKHSLRAALAEDIRNQYWTDLEQLVDKGLPPALSVRVIACLFGFSPSFVGAMVQRSHRYYRTFSIAQRTKRREIQAPRVSLKVIQSWLGCHLAKALSFEQCVYGFVAGRSSALAATVHCGAQWVHSFDLKDFFTSTPAREVSLALIGLGYSSHAADLISSLCSYKGFLAQGSPASPVLSNLVFRPIDLYLSKIARELDCRYTRYADDLVFSGISTVPTNLANLVYSSLVNTQWKFSKEKEHFAQSPNRLKVHGLLVHGTSPRLTKGYRKRIRAFKHLLEENKVRPEDKQKFLGHLSYASSIEAIILKNPA